MLVLFYGNCSLVYGRKLKDECSALLNGNEVALALQNIPVLSYHQVREWKAGDAQSARTYIISPDHFEGQMKYLHNKGYHPILPDQLFEHLSGKVALPEKPVLITFDDGTIGQFTAALPVLEKYGFKATFFIMTVTLNRPGYLSSSQVRALADRGNIIGCHTWDHHSVKDYKPDDWEVQLSKPTRQLAQITGRPICYFTYPFGLWNSNAIDQLRQRQYIGAFQLSGKNDEHYPEFTMRRTIVDGHFTTEQFVMMMTRFNK